MKDLFLFKCNTTIKDLLLTICKGEKELYCVFLVILSILLTIPVQSRYESSNKFLNHGPVRDFPKL